MRVRRRARLQSVPAMSPLGWQNISSLLWRPCGLLGIYRHLCNNSLMQNADSVPSLAIEITSEIPVGNSSEMWQHFWDNTPACFRQARRSCYSQGCSSQAEWGNTYRRNSFCGFTLKGQLRYLSCNVFRTYHRWLNSPELLDHTSYNPPCTWQHD